MVTEPLSMTAYQKEKSYLIFSLKVIATIMIVFVHGGNIFGYGKVDTPPFFHLFNVLAATGVPLFMIISGYLFFKKEIGWFQNLRKKTKRLVIPFVIWSGFWIIFELVGHFIMPSRFENVLSWSFSDFLFGFIGIPFSSGPLYSPLWYVRDLFLINLLAPFLFHPIRRYSWIIMGGTILLYILCAKYKIGYAHTVFLFLFGGAISAKTKDLSPYLNKISKLSFVPFVIGIGCSYVFNIFFDRIAILFFCFSFFLFFLRLVEKQSMFNVMICNLLSPYTFAIYVIHGKLLSILQILFISFSSRLWWIIIGYFILPIFCFVLCWGIALGFKKCLPNVYRICIGE